VGKVAVAAHRADEAERLLAAGANRVLHPYGFAANEVVELVAPQGRT
jgi:hypothetical protein